MSTILEQIEHLTATRDALQAEVNVLDKKKARITSAFKAAHDTLNTVEREVLAALDERNAEIVALVGTVEDAPKSAEPVALKAVS